MNTTAIDTYTCTNCASAFGAAEQPSECPKCGTAGSARTIPGRRTLTLARQNDDFRAGLVVGDAPCPAPWS